MTPGRYITLGLAACALGWAGANGSAHAQTKDFCVVCSDPQQTYLCRVATGRANPPGEALQLYCMVRTAKDGGHKSCAIARNPASACAAGLIKTYSYDGPALPKAVRESRERRRQNADPNKTPPVPSLIPEMPKQKGGEPDTLVEMTTKTGKKIGRLGKKATKTVGKTARGAGQIARDAGSTVGRAARFTYDCITSLFRDCSRDD